MHKDGVDRLSWFGALVWAATVLILAASVPAAAPAGSTDRPANAPPAPAASPAPEAAPAPAATPSPEASPAPAPSPQEEPPPRIIRTVCTDHVCGRCDGKCRKTSGHVAVDKKGHCACTPTDGSALDRAVRQAYERHPPQ